MFLPPNPRIETERLLLRLVEANDLDALLGVNGNDAVTRFLPYASWNGMADAEAWLNRMTARFETGDTGQFVIVLRESGAVIGSCLLFRFDAPSARAELGYVLAQEHWGKGYMIEAMQALVRFAFERLRVRRLEASIDPRNADSAKVLRRLGFQLEGVLRQHGVFKGELADTALYALLASEWTQPAAEAAQSP